jgi:hypothetical protein
MMMAMVHKRWFSLHGDDGGELRLWKVEVVMTDGKLNKLELAMY